jgi:hypothetical protein
MVFLESVTQILAPFPSLFQVCGVPEFLYCTFCIYYFALYMIIHVHCEKMKYSIYFIHSKIQRGRLVAHLLATAALWVRIQTSPKNTKWVT